MVDITIAKIVDKINNKIKILPLLSFLNIKKNCFV